MNLVFFLARFYPFWALPMALITGELAFYYYTRKFKKKLWFFLFWTLLYLGTAVLWVVFDGYNNSVYWIKYLSE